MPTGFAPNRLQWAFNADAFDAKALLVAYGGATSTTYTGQEVNPHVGYAHHFGLDTLALDPDVIVFMLGTNDTIRDRFSLYAPDVSGVFDLFQGFTNGRGLHPKVIVVTPLPILPHPTDIRYALGNERLNTQFIPWLTDQAENRGFGLLDLNTRIQQLPNWQSLYSDDGINPGYVHLWANNAEGNLWMAEEVNNAVQQMLMPVPEPGTWALALCMTPFILCLFRRRKR